MKSVTKFLLPFLLGVVLTSLFFVRVMYSMDHSAIIGQLLSGQTYIENTNNPDLQPQKIYDSTVGCYLSEARRVADSFWLTVSGPELIIQHKAWERVRWLRENLSEADLLKNSCLSQLQGLEEKGANKIVVRNSKG